MNANVAALEYSLVEESLGLQGLSALLADQDLIYSNDHGILNESQHYAFAAAGDDSLHYGQMRKNPDRSLFEADMQREVNDLVANESVKIVCRENLAAHTKVLASVWSFYYKRAPDWTVTKWEARLCPHGIQQVEEENFWESYAPVVTWSTVRLVLILSLLSGMKSCQVDDVQAYTQAPIDYEIYMAIPAQLIVNSSLNFLRTLSLEIVLSMCSFYPRTCMACVKLVSILMIVLFSRRWTKFLKSSSH